MRLRVMLPSRILLDQEVVKVVAEAQNGSFCLLPRHVDFVAALVPGLLNLVSPNGAEEFIAVDEGALVKCGGEVLVSVRHAVRGRDLGSLRRTVEEEFKLLDETEKAARAAMARMEADFIRHLMEL